MSRGWGRGEEDWGRDRQAWKSSSHNWGWDEEATIGAGMRRLGKAAREMASPVLGQIRMTQKGFGKP